MHRHHIELLEKYYREYLEYYISLLHGFWWEANPLIETILGRYQVQTFLSVMDPIGRIRTDSNLKKVGRENITDESYINAATGFANSNDMKKLHDIKTMSAAGLMIAAFIGVIIWMLSVQVRRR